MAKVSVRNLTKIFGKKSQQTQALKMVEDQHSKNEILEKTGATVGVYDASFDVHEGEIFVIMGLSGSGKSTLIRLLNRLIEPTSGTIYLDDENISAMKGEELRKVRQEKLNMVFQSFALFPHMTILENTQYGMEIRGVDEEEKRQRAEKALDNSGLLEFKDQYPNQLSGGMQQRVGLARALANDPDVLLMDEAFSALDPLIRRQMQDELLDLQKSDQRTIIFITHDLNEALRLGDRIAIMKDGRIMQIGTGEEILTDPANDYVRDFVEEVDRSKVLTAENIMIPAIFVNVDHDGPGVALNRMRNEGVRILLAVDGDRQLKGYLQMNDVVLARQEGQPLTDHIKTDIVSVAPDVLVEEMFSLNEETPAPIAVTENNRLLGVIRRGTILDALSKTSKEDMNA